MICDTHLYHAVRNTPIPEDVQKCKKVFVDRDDVDTDVYKNGHQISYGRTVRSLYVDVSFPSDKKAPHSGQPKYGIFDTGAQSVSIRPEIAYTNGWKILAHANVSGAVSSIKVPIFRVPELKLHFDTGTVSVRNVLAWGTPLPGHTEVLVGQPVIKLREFKVSKGFDGVKWG